MRPAIVMAAGVRAAFVENRPEVIMKACILLLVTACSLLPAVSAVAAPPGTCSVTPVGSISFGNYDVFSTVPLDAVGTIQITCDLTEAHTIITLGPSQNGSGFSPRQMKNVSSGDLLAYNLFTNTARTTVWGDGTGGTSTVTQRVFKKTPAIVTIYGRMAAAQNVRSGTYTDTVTVTINW